MRVGRASLSASVGVTGTSVSEHSCWMSLGLFFLGVTVGLLPLICPHSSMFGYLFSTICTTVISRCRVNAHIA